MATPLKDTDLDSLKLWLEDYRANNTPLSLLRMAHGPISQAEIGPNISFEDLVDIINQTRADDHWFRPGTEIVLIVVYILVIIAGLALNMLICYVVLKEKKLRTIRNMFIVNLAVSDMVMCLFCMPSTLVKLLLKNWALGDSLCRIIPWLQATNVFASTITITAIALDRYHVIIYPCVGKQRMKVIGAVSFIVSIWIASGIVGLPLAVYSKTAEETYFIFVTFTMCIEQWPSDASRYSYAAVVMVLQFLIPIFILFGVHWKISNFLKCRINKNPKTKLEMKRAMKEATRHRKNTFLLMAIAIMYALCWFPLTLLNFLADFNYNMFIHRNFLLAYASAHLIAMTSAIANPILYGWFNSNFKREFTKVVCATWRVTSNEEEPEGDRLHDECCRLVEKHRSRAVYTQPMRYKAIQTEIQPYIPAQALNESPAATTEECRIASGSSDSTPNNTTPSRDVNRIPCNHPRRVSMPAYSNAPSRGVNNTSYCSIHSQRARNAPFSNKHTYIVHSRKGT